MAIAAHKAAHLWIRLHTGVRCAYMSCDAEPDAKAVAKLEAEERHIGRPSARSGTRIRVARAMGPERDRARKSSACLTG